MKILTLIIALVAFGCGRVEHVELRGLNGADGLGCSLVETILTCGDQEIDLAGLIPDPIPGVDGKDGIDGKDGKDGQDGSDGISCSLTGTVLTCGDDSLDLADLIDSEGSFCPPGQQQNGVCTGSVGKPQ